MWKTTDAISSGLFVCRRVGAARHPAQLRCSVQAPRVSRGIGNPSAFPSRKHDLRPVVPTSSLAV